MIKTTTQQMQLTLHKTTLT